MAMTKINTSSGFSCEINEEALQDAELLEWLVGLDDGDYKLYPKLMNKLLGVKVKEKLYNHIRTKDGRVPYESLNTELGEIFAQLGSKKK